MHRVTYLVGAGASAGVLPVVTDVPGALRNFIGRIEGFTMNGASSREASFAKDLIEEYKWLENACKRHASIDTFAKKLFIRKNERDLFRLKLLLSLYFMHIQASKQCDKRYDSFFASIINDSVDNLPPIKILSWNYDSQFEIAFDEFSQFNDLPKLREKLNVHSRSGEKYRDGRYQFNLVFYEDQFSILKINGVAGFVDDKSNEIVDFVYSNNPYPLREIRGVLYYYEHFRDASKIQSQISFAWERHKSKDVVKMVSDFASETTVLVVIGYSFPFFNREVDKALLATGMPHLKKVYFQDPKALVVKERFLSLRNDIPDNNLVLRSDKEQFLLPDELSI